MAESSSPTGAVLRHHYGGVYRFHCPACNGPHSVLLTGQEAWQWNGNSQKPTIRPSIRVTWEDPAPHVCHSYVIEGQIQFFDDCTHPLAGQSAPLPAFFE